MLRATMDISAHTFSLAAVRNRWFADSLLEGTGFEPSVPREAAGILVISVLASKSRTLPTTGPGQPCSTLDRGGVIARLSRLQRVHWAPSPKTAASREAGSCGRCPGGSRGGAGGAAEDIVLG